jgi:glycosyltransferase involved in cell wall biosynthesis
MKVVISHGLPFSLAHGGSQTFIEAMLKNLPEAGVEVEPERWWDERQTCDILHCVGRPAIMNVRLAHEKGWRVMMTEFLEKTASRSRSALVMQKLIMRTAQKMLGGMTARMGWDVYREADALVYSTQLEWNVAQRLFDAPANRGFVVPHGLDDDALAALSRADDEEDYLISIATISPRKNQLALAEAAKIAGVPVLFVGKPFSEADPYYLRFKQMVDGKFVRYAGFVSTHEKHRLIRRARGFVLFSLSECGCIALYEAAAAGLPFLLSDLPWASVVYGHCNAARFVKLQNADVIARTLRDFYENSHRRSAPTFQVGSWREIAGQYARIYQQVCNYEVALPGT